MNHQAEPQPSNQIQREATPPHPPYYLIKRADRDEYACGLLDAHEIEWCDAAGYPERFDTLTDATDYLATWGSPDEPAVVQIVNPPAVDSIVQVTSNATWCGRSLHGRLAQVLHANNYQHGVLLTLQLWDGWYREGTPAFGSFVYLFAHEVRLAELPEVGQASRPVATEYSSFCHCPGEVITANGGLTADDRCPICGTVWRAA